MSQASPIRGALAAFLILAATVVSGCARRSAGRPPQARSRDLILITIDTLRADRVGVDGGPSGLTPALDALGHRGAVFLDATAQAPLTLPSHTSILTGRFPSAHGVHDNAGFALPDTVPTLASILHGAGYHTAAFVSSYVLRGSTGLSRGFDLYDDRFAGIGQAHLLTTSLERRAPEVARLAAKWLASAPRPYFLWVHFYDPHAPYDPPPAFAARFPGRPYDGEVATADFGVATLLDALPADRRADTLVIATGDHGESLGEHGEQEHGIFLYDATLHVPLIIAGPDVPRGASVARQVRHVDIVPTALALVGMKPPAGLDGESLVALMTHASPEDAPPSYAESRFGELHFGWSALESVRDGQWKFVKAPSPELYQLRSDPGERRNLDKDRPATAAAMAEALTRLSPAAPAAPPAAGADADAAERLRSLGYLSSRVTLDAGGAGADPKQEIARYVAYVGGFNAALAALESGRAADAEAGFRALARSFPRAFEAHQYLARALAARGDQRSALAEYDAAIALGPREAVVYFDAARSLAASGDDDRAFARVAEGLRLEPSSFYGWLTRGLVAQAAGQPGAAEQAFDEALQINPALAVAHFELGRLAEARGNLVGAKREYRQALDGDPSLADARHALERVSR